MRTRTAESGPGSDTRPQSHYNSLTILRISASSVFLSACRSSRCRTDVFWNRFANWDRISKWQREPPVSKMNRDETGRPSGAFISSGRSGKHKKIRCREASFKSGCVGCGSAIPLPTAVLINASRLINSRQKTSAEISAGKSACAQTNAYTSAAAAPGTP